MLPRTPAISSASAVPSPRTPPWLTPCNFQPQPVVPGQHHSTSTSRTPCRWSVEVQPLELSNFIFRSPVPGLVFVFFLLLKAFGHYSRLLSPATCLGLPIGPHPGSYHNKQSTYYCIYFKLHQINVYVGVCLSLCVHVYSESIQTPSLFVPAFC